eukprot:m.40260 g.40260  ORF g.40260 m.40260 type:complete len:127 (+) comp6913_c1_seq1:1193-1573(+)
MFSNQSAEEEESLEEQEEADEEEQSPPPSSAPIVITSTPKHKEGMSLLESLGITPFRKDEGDYPTFQSDETSSAPTASFELGKDADESMDVEDAIVPRRRTASKGRRPSFLRRKSTSKSNEMDSHL